MGVLGQPVFLGMIGFVVICIVMLVGILALLRNMQSNQQAAKKARMESEFNQPLEAVEDDDFDLFLPSDDFHPDDDPLAELYSLEDDNEPEIALGSLLSGDVQPKIHSLSDDVVTVNLTSGGTTHARELLGILRDEEDGRLMVLAGDTAYRTLLDTPEVKNQFTTTMKELSTIILKPDDRETSQAQDKDEDDLASLLSSMGQEVVNPITEDVVTVKLASGATTQAQELLRILRDEEDGRLMVLAGDTAYRTLLDSAEVKTQFTVVMKELSSIILKPDDRPQKAVSAPKPTTKSVAPSMPPSSATSGDSSVGGKVDLTIKAAKDLELEERLPGDLPSMKLPDNPDNYKVGRFGQVQVKRVDSAPELNIAEAIEAYLQYKIEQDPQYQKRGIHIKPALGGGVRIEADGKSYDFVDEVENADVKAFIQTAIDEWQERH